MTSPFEWFGFENPSSLGFSMLQVLLDHDAGLLRCYHSDSKVSQYLQRFRNDDIYGLRGKNANNVSLVSEVVESETWLKIFFYFKFFSNKKNNLKLWFNTPLNSFVTLSRMSDMRHSNLLNSLNSSTDKMSKQTSESITLP